MTKLQINALEVRQLELLAIMASSDARASKSTKNGISFREEYPTEYADYIAANQEYNANEVKLVELKAQQRKKEDFIGLENIREINE